MDVLVDRVAPGAMILGSAQWGQEYGIANTSGPPARSELGRIVDAASRAGVTSIDTARDYGRSEALIGEVVGGASGWWVMTKLSGDLVTEDADPRVVTERAEASLRASLRALRRPRIDVLLLHRAWHRDWGGGVLWDLLEDHRRRGTVAGIGVSVTSPDDVGSLVGEGSVDVVQVTAGLLDQRLARLDVPTSTGPRSTTVVSRSIFLQGAALLAPDRLPGHLRPLGPVLRSIDDWCAGYGLTRREALLLYARDTAPGPVIVGAESLDQTEANLRTWSAPPLGDDRIAELAGLVPPLADTVLDPWRWP